MKKLQIKTFMPDSKRPTWLIMLLSYVKTYFPTETTWNNENIRAWLISAFDEVEYVRRNDRTTVSKCMKYTETDDTVTVYTIHKENPVVEFKIVEKVNY